MANWSQIENQYLLKTIQFKRPPIISYKTGKSLTDMLERGKNMKAFIMQPNHKNHIGSPCSSIFDFLSMKKCDYVTMLEQFICKCACK